MSDTSINDDWVRRARTDPEFGGSGFDTNLKNAKSVLSPDLKKALSDSGLGSHPEVVRAFFRISKEIDRGVQHEDLDLSAAAGALYAKKNLSTGAPVVSEAAPDDTPAAAAAKSLYAKKVFTAAAAAATPAVAATPVDPAATALYAKKVIAKKVSTAAAAPDDGPAAAVAASLYAKKV